MKSYKCPNCGAELTVEEEDREFAFCQYCGTKITLIDIRDEVTLKKAEIEKEIRLREMEFADNAEKRKHRSSVVKYLVGGILIAVAAICYLFQVFPEVVIIGFYFGLFIVLVALAMDLSRGSKRDLLQGLGVKKTTPMGNRMPSGINYEGWDPESAKRVLESYGFSDIHIISAGDIEKGAHDSRIGKVAYVTIDGKNPTYGMYCSWDEQVVIACHGYSAYGNLQQEDK